MLLYKKGNNQIRWEAGERLDHLFTQRCDQFVAEGKQDHPAVIIGDQLMTFQEMDRRANQVARYLIQNHVQAGDRVGLVLDKSFHTYVTLLAVLKVNAAFVPLDASFPDERIAYIAADADIKTIITLSQFEAQLKPIGIPLLLIDTATPHINYLPPIPLTDFERGSLALTNQLCYIIYTSGTTGNPKGVCIEHASICNFVRVAAEEYGITEHDRIYQGMTIAFDFSVEELWVPLLAGATLIPGAGNQLVGRDLAQFLSKNEVTGLCCVPTLLATIDQDLPQLRYLMVSGEACPHDLVVRWHHPDRTILNAYGPTEATVTATLTELYPNKPVTIGQPLLTYTVVILDEHQDKLLTQGEQGEIGIAGIGLAKGYLNRDDLTAQKFIPDFIGIPNNPSKRIYRSGDLGRINGDHEVEYLGRIDTQVKIRGYRIELTEIESVFMQMPGVAQAVVDTWTPHTDQPNTKELVAYYTLKVGAADLDHTTLSEHLRTHLPSYMVPGYLDRLDEIPLSTSNKADRKRLPTPTGNRLLSGTQSAYVAPRSELEQTLTSALETVLNIEKPSANADFFSELGAHSLLMAQFCTKIRDRLGDQVNVSMRDVYAHNSVSKLAAHLETSETAAPEPIAPLVTDFYKPSDFAYYSCGALQLAYYVIMSYFASWVGFSSLKWIYAQYGDWSAMAGRAGVIVVLLFWLFAAVPIAVKWLLIGTYREEVIPLWSLRYLRFWIVKQVTLASPIALFKGTPIYNTYLRLLGAKIGKNVIIQSKTISPCFDLINIGDDTILRRDSILLGYKVRGNLLYTGKSTLGSNVYVGEKTVIDINSVMEDETQIGHASSLHTGQTVPTGKRFHGSPAEETTTDFCTLDPKKCSLLRKMTYLGIQYLLLLLGAIVGIFIFMWIISIWLATPNWLASFQNFSSTTFLNMFAVSLILFCGGIALALLFTAIMPRLFNLPLKPDKTYVLYGLHHFCSSAVTGLSNSRAFNILFGDSSYIIGFLRMVGYGLRDVDQTGSNFGLLQKHDNPYLCSIGRGTMVSDGLNMVNTKMSTTAFKLSPVNIGANNFLGNNVYIPAEGRIGENCLIGTKAMVPIDGALRANVGLLGSPSFEIPRNVQRDSLMDRYLETHDRTERIQKKNVHNIISMLSYLGINWVYFYVALMIANALIVWAGASLGAIHLFIQGWLMLGLAIAYFPLFEWIALKFKRQQAQTVTIYEKNYWAVERYWKFGSNVIDKLFKGTPFRPMLYRLLGVNMGRKVFDDGCHITERTLVTVNDYANLNDASILQCHSLEDGVFKTAPTTIGMGCTVETAAFVHYGVTVDDYAVVAADSFVMKGSTVAAETAWLGNPAEAYGSVEVREMHVAPQPVSQDAVQEDAPRRAPQFAFLTAVVRGLLMFLFGLGMTLGYAVELYSLQLLLWLGLIASSLLFIFAIGVIIMRLSADSSDE